MVIAERPRIEEIVIPVLHVVEKPALRKRDLRPYSDIVCVEIIDAGRYRNFQGEANVGFYPYPANILMDLEEALKLEQEEIKKKKQPGIWNEKERAQIIDVVEAGLGNVYSISPDTTTFNESGKAISKDGDVIFSSDALYPRDDTCSERRQSLYELAFKCYEDRKLLSYRRRARGEMNSRTFRREMEAAVGAQLSIARELHVKDMPMTKQDMYENMQEAWTDMQNSL